MALSPYISMVTVMLEEILVVNLISVATHCHEVRVLKGRLIVVESVLGTLMVTRGKPEEGSVARMRQLKERNW